MSFYPQQQQSSSQMVPSVALRKYLRKLSTSSSSEQCQEIGHKFEQTVTDRVTVVDCLRILCLVCHCRSRSFNDGINDRANDGAALLSGNDKPDDEVFCYADQFLCGLNKCKGLHSAPSLEQHPQAGEMLLSMLPILHIQGPIQSVVDEGLIEKHLLSRKSLGNKSTIITGKIAETSKKGAL
jgi:hypothetical protein